MTLPRETSEHLRRVLSRPEPAGGRYEIREPVGQGGMGTVYRAYDRELEREVALKVLRPDLVDAEAAPRLEREARILARLEHPGIVPVHDAGTLSDGRVFYVMKLVRGEGLEEFASRATLTEILRLFLRVCETIGFAHARGVVHRDLKPSNIMVGAFGEVLVLDWGIARILKEPEFLEGAAHRNSADGERTGGHGARYHPRHPRFHGAGTGGGTACTWSTHAPTCSPSAQSSDRSSDRKRGRKTLLGQ